MKRILGLILVVLLLSGCPASAPYQSDSHGVDGAAATVRIYGTFENYDVIGVTFKGAHEFVVLKNRTTGMLAGATTSHVVSEGKTSYSVQLSSAIIEEP